MGGVSSGLGGVSSGVGGVSNGVGGVSSGGEILHFSANNVKAFRAASKLSFLLAVSSTLV